MASFNQIILIGRLGQDPETYTSNTGTEVVKFSIAVDEFKTTDKTTLWFKAVSFGKTAVHAREYLKKGDMTQIVGRLSYVTRVNKDGVEYKDYSVLLDRFNKLSQGSGAAPQSFGVSEKADPELDKKIDNDDIPF